MSNEEQDGALPHEEDASRIPDRDDEHVSQIPSADAAPPAADGGRKPPRPRKPSVVAASGFDAAVRAAFGGSLEDGTPSVLHRIGGRAGSGAAIHLPDPEDVTRPMLRPTPDDGGDTNRYRVLGEIARGGVGTVLQVRDTDLGRDVAVKVLHDRYAQNEDVVQRFVEEAQVGGQLQHPGIVPVYELGVQKDGRPFFAMKLVKGETLSALLERRRTPQDDRAQMLQIFQKICQTMAYAHARKVIHRDLKPSNVMVGTYGEVQVVDWGFAKVLGRGGVQDEKRSRRARSEISVIETVRSGSSGSGSESQAGAVLGTPAYMPPEQALGDIEVLDERTDVFALGAILCEILTGRPPYGGGPEKPLVEAARGKLDAAYAALARCGAHPKVVRLAKACLAPRRLDRPRDASEVARAISAYLHSREEQARQAEVKAGAAEARAEAEAKARKRILLWAGAAVGALVLGIVGVYLAGQARAERREQTARLVDTEMRTATELARRARSRGDDASEDWHAAVVQAREAIALAEREGADEATLVRVRTLAEDLEAARARAVRRVERRAADAALADALREHGIRTRLGDGDAAGDRLVLALAEWGLRLRRDAPAEAEEVLADTPLREAVLQAVDLVRLHRPAEERPTLDAILAQVDPDPWRAEVRALVADPVALGARAAAFAAADRSTHDALLLSDALAARDDLDGARRILARAQAAHPRDAALAVAVACRATGGDEPDWSTARRAIALLKRSGPVPGELQRLEARAFLHEGDVERALASARSLHAEQPDEEANVTLLAEALHARAEAREAADEHVAAAANWRESLMLRPEEHERRRALIQALRRGRDFDAATAVAREHIRRDPEDWRRHAELRTVLLARMRREGSTGFGEALVDAARTVLILCPADERTEQTLQLAQCLEYAGLLVEAESLCGELLAGDPSPAVRLRGLGLLSGILIGQGQHARARRHVEAALALAGPSVAQDEVTRVAALNARMNKARILIIDGERDEAVTLIDACAKDMPETASNCRLTAERYLDARANEQALVWAEKALELDPGHPRTLYAKARALLGTRRFADALETIDVAAQAGHASAGYLRVHALLYNRQFNRALEALDRSVLRYGDLQSLGSIARRFGAERVAYRVWGRMLLAQPQDWKNRITLAELLAQTKDPGLADAERALEVLEGVPLEQIRGSGWFGDVQSARSQALTRLGRLAEARAAYAEVVRSYERIGYSAMHGEIARLEWLAGDFQAAEDRLTEALENLDAAPEYRDTPQGTVRRMYLYATRGVVLLDRGRHAAAASAMEETLEFTAPYKGSLSFSVQGIAYWQQAELALRRGNPTAALEHCEQAQTLADRGGHLRGWRAYVGLQVARAEHARGDKAQARYTAERALAGIRELGKGRDRWHEAEALLVNGLLRADDPDDASLRAQARAYLEEARDRGRALDHAPTIVLASCALVPLGIGSTTEAAALLASLESRLSLHHRIEAYHRLWKADAGERHRAAARSALDALLALQGEEERAALVRDVPRYAELAKR